MVSSSRIFVKGLPPSLTVEDFRKHFSKQSPITDIKLIPHRRIGYVGFRTPDDAARAVKYHDRSFIRMSKIGVELARSVVEQQQVSRSRPIDTFLGEGNLAPTTIDPPANGGQILSPTTPATRRAQLEKGPEENEKLREFLEVMQPPSKSKGWDNQDVLHPTTVPLLARNPTRQMPPATDEKSDGEYEPMRKKIKVSIETPENNTIEGSTAHDLPIVDSEIGVQLVENEAAMRPAQSLGPEPPLAASDEDWLRSRTSRLLGLVDDEETSIVKSPISGNDKPRNEFDKASELEEEDQSEELIEYPRPMDGEGGNNEQTVTKNNDEPITGNGRLFLRNLTYTLTEEDIRKHFEDHGCGGIEEVRKDFSAL